MTTRFTLLVASLALAACSTSDVSLGGSGTLVRVDPEAAGVNCATGGVAIHTGTDLDDDQFLDDTEITSTQFVCDGITPVQCEGGSMVSGEITIHTAADWAALDGIHCIDGDLLVAGVADDLDARPDLSVVTGNVVLAANPSLTSLDVVSGLREVGGTYLVQGNSALTDLGSLGALDRAQSIVVLGNNALTDLHGLDALTNFEGGIRISDNGALTSLAGLDHLTTCGGTLSIVSNRNLASVDALASLQDVVELEISSNDGLPTVTLPALTRIQVRLLVNTNPALDHVTLPVLATTGDFLRFDGDPTLTTISAPALLAAGGMEITTDTLLETLDAPKLVYVTGTIDLRTLPALTTIGLGALTSIGRDLTVNGASQLTDLAGLDTVESVGGNVLVRSNPALVDFTGLGALTFVASNLTIDANGVLTSFAGLDALTQVGAALVITNNPDLPTATATAFASSITVGSSTTITGNG